MSRGRYIIVDGYNVIGRGDRYRGRADEDLDAARAQLVSDVAAYAQGLGRALVVFDGAGNPHSDGLRHEVAGVEVIFSRYGIEADSVIEEAAIARRGEGYDVTVVTSDAQTQWAVMGAGVTRMSATDFVREIAGEQDQRRESVPAGSTRTTVSERVDEQVAAVLERWAKGEP